MAARNEKPENGERRPGTLPLLRPRPHLTLVSLFPSHRPCTFFVASLSLPRLPAAPPVGRKGRSALALREEMKRERARKVSAAAWTSVGGPRGGAAALRQRAARRADGACAGRAGRSWRRPRASCGSWSRSTARYGRGRRVRGPRARAAGAAPRALADGDMVRRFGEERGQLAARIAELEELAALDGGNKFRKFVELKHEKRSLEQGCTR